MRIRRSARSRPVVALLIACFAMALGWAGVVEGHGPTTDGGGSGFRPRPVARTTLTAAGLRGRLPALIAAARSANLRGSVLSGLETRTGDSGPEVAVGFRLTQSDSEVGDARGPERTLAALVAAGARVANRDGDRVEAYLPGAALRVLASLSGIADARPIIRPIPLAGIGALGEGVTLHGADGWQAAGITGSGVKVGIIDGGFVGLTGRLGLELPATVQVHCYQQMGVYSTAAASCETATPHGTAVAETVSDMAPGATLYLANPISFQDMAATVTWMTGNGVKIINVSLGFGYEGPGDGGSLPGTMYTIVDQAVKAGALWVNAAGNSGEDGWIGAWQDADGNGLMDFAPGDEGNAIGLKAGDEILATLRWNDPWGHAADDYDLLIYGPGGSTPLASSEDQQTGSEDPVETVDFNVPADGTYRLVIRRSDGNPVSRLQLLVLTERDAPLQYRTPDDTLASPADSANPGMVSVGAVAFDTPTQVEPFSSRGPTLDNRIKPDFVAADCATTSLITPFCGTSQSSPYAAGAAALVLSAYPKLKPAELADFLRSHAIPIGSPVPNSTSGSGRLALGLPPQPPTPTTLSFASAPLVGEAGVAFRPNPSIQILDQDAEPITVGPGATGSVTLGLGTNPGSAALTCDGGLTLPAAAGIATFTGCSISVPGVAYTLTASLAGVPDATTAPFDIFPLGQGPPTPTLTISSSLAAVTYGAAITLTAKVVVPAGGPALNGRSMTIQSSTDGATWLPIAHVTTGAAGTGAATYKPATNLRYRAMFDGAADLYPATGSTIKVSVRQIVSLRPTNGAKIRAVSRTKTTLFTATVRPLAGLQAGVVTFEVSALIGTRWLVVSTHVVNPDSAGVARIGIIFRSPGNWSIRAKASPTALNSNSDWTARERFRST